MKYVLKLILFVVCALIAGLLYHTDQTDSYANTLFLLLIFVSQKTWFDDY